jgi:hypothetical protein
MNDYWIEAQPQDDEPWYIRHPVWTLLGALGVAAMEVFARPFCVPVAGVAIVVSWGVSIAGLVRHRRQRIEQYRRWTHRCLRCGYSLIGNTSGVCPECGRPATIQ